ncbi:MAG: recombinase family protein [Flavobacteriaceae bacterium]|nr:recombinase family protein [Flavobacteriaceae bacterium]MCY4215583.1 recombinase family protein [Flavobacteriaceae bacterium]MCY4253200.1 recombinase family protein [Flavobacteriaceae bacterium]
MKYLRTSHFTQEGKRFDLEKTPYDRVFFDQGVSRTIPFAERPEGSVLMKWVKKGLITQLVTDEVSRLGRNTKDVLGVLETLQEHQVNVVIQELGMDSCRANGKENPYWKVVLTMMNCLYEMEQKALLERTRQGIQAYKERGRRLDEKSGRWKPKKHFYPNPKQKRSSVC